MRKLLLASVSACALAVAPHADAQVVTCTNCDTSVQGEQSLAQQLLAYTEQGLQLNEETVTAVRETTDALPLGTNAFEDLTADISNILGIVNTANMLVGQTGQIIQQIETLGGFPLTSINGNWHQAFTDEANAVGRAMYVCGEVNGILNGIANDAHLLSVLVTQVMDVIGHQQSFQTLSAQLSQLGQNIQKIESGKMGCNQAFATYYAAQQHHQYLAQSVSDHDLEVTWVNQCHAISDLGGTPPSNICAGAQ